MEGSSFRVGDRVKITCGLVGDGWWSLSGADARIAFDPGHPFTSVGVFISGGFEPRLIPRQFIEAIEVSPPAPEPVCDIFGCCESPCWTITIGDQVAKICPGHVETYLGDFGDIERCEIVPFVKSTMAPPADGDKMTEAAMKFAEAVAGRPTTCSQCGGKCTHHILDEKGRQYFGCMFHVPELIQYAMAVDPSACVKVLVL
jgi:hypothetical protein